MEILTPEEIAHRQRPITRREIIMLDLNDKWEADNADKIIALVQELFYIDEQERDEIRRIEYEHDMNRQAEEDGV
jgi:hypothetical protein